MLQNFDKSKIASDIRKLSIMQRLDILTDIWDEIKESKELEAISAEEKRILLKDYRITKTIPVPL